jgi:chromosome segregation ATPase
MFLQFGSAELQDSMEELRNTENEYKNAKRDCKESMRRVHEAHEVAVEKAPLKDDAENELPLKAELEALGVETLDEALLALEEADAKVENIHADHNAIREYERNQAETEEVQAQLADLKGMEERQKKALDEKVLPWQKVLLRAVEKVDTLFGKYMSEMGCTGELQDISFFSFEISASAYSNFSFQVRCS